jgi:predicted nucleic acid-binding protein
MTVVRIPKNLNVVPRDPDDNALLECAIESNADYVVSGEGDLLELKQFRGIQILRDSEFLGLLMTRTS